MSHIISSDFTLFSKLPDWLINYSPLYSFGLHLNFISNNLLQMLSFLFVGSSDVSRSHKYVHLLVTSLNRFQAYGYNIYSIQTYSTFHLHLPISYYRILQDEITSSITV